MHSFLKQKEELIGNVTLLGSLLDDEPPDIFRLQVDSVCFLTPHEQLS